MLINYAFRPRTHAAPPTLSNAPKKCQQGQKDKGIKSHEPFPNLIRAKEKLTYFLSTMHTISSEDKSRVSVLLIFKRLGDTIP